MCVCVLVLIAMPPLSLAGVCEKETVCAREGERESVCVCLCACACMCMCVCVYIGADCTWLLCVVE